VNSAPVLLLITGILLGFTFPLGKLAFTAGIPALVWAFWVSAGSSIGLITLRCLLQGRGLGHDRVHVNYYIQLAIVSLVVPNALIFLLIPKLGSGFVSLFFTLSPVFTLAISIVLRIRVPNRLAVMGIAISCSGAFLAGVTRGDVSAPASLYWAMACVLIPVSLALGNIYRTTGWPEGSAPLELAAGTNTAAAFLLAMSVALTVGVDAFQTLFYAPLLVGLQMLSSTGMFLTFFRLQQIGGPTYLSQIGYVAAPVALLIGTLFLGERYAALTWIGCVVLLIGLTLVVKAMRLEQR